MLKQRRGQKIISLGGQSYRERERERGKVVKIGILRKIVRGRWDCES